jgi:hypothetical protein
MKTQLEIKIIKMIGEQIKIGNLYTDTIISELMKYQFFKDSPIDTIHQHTSLFEAQRFFKMLKGRDGYWGEVAELLIFDVVCTQVYKSCKTIYRP